MNLPRDDAPRSFHPIRAALLLAIISLVTGCAPKLHEQTTFDPAADFKDLKTYSMKPNTQEIIKIRMLNGQPMAKTIEQCIAQELDARGLKQVPPGQAQLIVRWLGNIRYTQGSTQVGPTPLDLQKDFANDDYPYDKGAGGWSSQPYLVTNGALVIDMVDPKLKRSVWRGTIEGVINENRADPERVKRLNQALAKLFAKFPPK